MIGKNTIKLITSLKQKKYRSKENLFVAEGDKLVSEVIRSNLTIRELFITSDFPEKEPDQAKIHRISAVEYNELKKVSYLTTPQNSLAICHIPVSKPFPERLEQNLSLFLDGIQDPGNMGTILRICDWFGITNVFCSKDTVDIYNPKVVQASMGSFLRVHIWECEYDQLVQLAQASEATLYGAFMDGNNLYTDSLDKNAILVMGNEGRGIRPEVEKLIQKRISIPNFSLNNTKAESLNVSVATAIICSEFKRGTFPIRNEMTM